jgi:hypothetical protein
MWKPFDDHDRDRDSDLEYIYVEALWWPWPWPWQWPWRHICGSPLLTVTVTMTVTVTGTLKTYMWKPFAHRDCDCDGGPVGMHSRPDKVYTHTYIYTYNACKHKLRCPRSRYLYSSSQRTATWFGSWQKPTHPNWAACVQSCIHAYMHTSVIIHTHARMFACMHKLYTYKHSCICYVRTILHACINYIHAFLHACI